MVHSSNEYSYLSLSSADYLLDCAAQLREPVSLIEDSVKALHPAAATTIIETEKGRYSAKTVYDSRPPKIAEDGLRQHFLGWQIYTKEPIKDPDMATLMDFRVDQSKGLHFVYALPFSDHHMLIESTLISAQVQPPAWYRNAIECWLRDNNIEATEVICEEAGVIPMDTLATEPDAANIRALRALRPKPLIATIGAASGAVRRSSGYAFQHIQQQISQLAAGIAQGNMAVPTPISSRLTAMDEVFNGCAAKSPGSRRVTVYAHGQGLKWRPICALYARPGNRQRLAAGDSRHAQRAVYRRRLQSKLTKQSVTEATPCLS